MSHASIVPKVFHVIWVGDESRRPDNCIETWRALNPSWAIRIWDNDDLARGGWINARHMAEMSKREWNGVADLMRWEILHRHGGFAIDADGYAVRRLPDSIFKGVSGSRSARIFAGWENERVMPGLLAAGYVAALPGESFFLDLVRNLERQPTVTNARAWQTVGPLAFTQAYQSFVRRSEAGLFRVWPSHYFLPEHHSGVCYSGRGRVYGRQFWASTKKLYGCLHRARIPGTAEIVSR